MTEPTTTTAAPHGADAGPAGAHAHAATTPSAPAGLSAEERVWEALQDHRGADSAITQELLAEICDMPLRRLQKVLKILTEENGRPIAASCRPPYGVFIPETPEEAEPYINQLRARGLSVYRRIKALDRAIAREHVGDLFRDIGQRDDDFRGSAGESEPPAPDLEGASCACGCGQIAVPKTPQAKGKKYVDEEHKRRHEHLCREAGQLYLEECIGEPAP